MDADQPPSSPARTHDAETRLRIEQFAQTMAHVRHFGVARQAEVLSRLGMSPDVYKSWSMAVPVELAKERPPGAGHLGKSFKETLMRVLGQLKRDQPQLESISALEPLPSAAQASDSNPDDTLPIRRPISVRAALPFQPGPPRLIATPSVNIRNDGTGTLPPEPPRPPLPCTSAWSIVTYAQFVADRRRFDAMTVRRAYGVADADAEVALMAHFNRQFVANPALREEWLRLLSTALEANGQKGR